MWHTRFLKKLVVLSLLLASSKNTTNPHTSATLPSPSQPPIQRLYDKDVHSLRIIMYSEPNTYAMGVVAVRRTRACSPKL